jgi:hypothetical protein
MQKFFGALVLGIAGVAAQAAGQSATAGELNVQGSSATGGDSTVIRGRVYGRVDFSVTGAFNDSATVTLGPGGGFQAIGTLTIRQLATGGAGTLGPLVRRDAIQLPDGQTRVFLSVNNAQPAFSGGAVTLRRGTSVIDSDPIQLSP